MLDLDFSNQRHYVGDHIDSTTPDGAQALKAMIESYWRARGHIVQIVIGRSFGNLSLGQICTLQSDLVDGLPSSARKKLSRETGATQ